MSNLYEQAGGTCENGSWQPVGAIRIKDLDHGSQRQPGDFGRSPQEAQGTRVSDHCRKRGELGFNGLRTPGGDPYRRKTIAFRDVMDRAAGVPKLTVDKIGTDKSDFGLPGDYPGHPGANAQGYVKTPNVKPMIEMMDLKQAQRSYEANVSVIDTSKSMMQRTIDPLRN